MSLKRFKRNYPDDNGKLQKMLDVWPINSDISFPATPSLLLANDTATVSITWQLCTNEYCICGIKQSHSTSSTFRRGSVHVYVNRMPYCVNTRQLHCEPKKTHQNVFRYTDYKIWPIVIEFGTYCQWRSQAITGRRVKAKSADGLADI